MNIICSFFFRSISYLKRFNQPFIDKKSSHHHNHKSISSHPPFAPKSFANLPLNHLLPPIYKDSELLNNFSGKSLEAKRSKGKKESYAEFTKLVSLQTRNLEKLLKKFDTSDLKHTSPKRHSKKKDTQMSEINNIQVETKGYNAYQSKTLLIFFIYDQINNYFQFSCLYEK